MNQIRKAWKPQDVGVGVLGKWGAKILILFALLFCMVGAVQAQTPVSLSPWVKPQFLDANGKPLAFGKVFTYLAGTTTQTPTYFDPLGTVQNSNPIILDSGGYASIYLPAQAFKFVVFSASGVNQWTVDDINQSATFTSPATIANPNGNACLDINATNTTNTSNFTVCANVTDGFNDELKITNTSTAAAKGVEFTNQLAGTTPFFASLSAPTNSWVLNPDGTMTASAPLGDLIASGAISGGCNIASGGTSVSLGENFYVTQGVATNAVLQVTAVSGAAATGCVFVSPGTQYVAGSSVPTVAQTGGGTGLTINITSVSNLPAGSIPLYDGTRWTTTPTSFGTPISATITGTASQSGTITNCTCAARVSVYLYTSTAGSAGTAKVAVNYQDPTITAQTCPTNGFFPGSTIDLTTLGSFHESDCFLLSGSGFIATPVSYAVTVTGGAGGAQWTLVYVMEKL